MLSGNHGVVLKPGPIELKHNLFTMSCDSPGSDRTLSWYAKRREEKKQALDWPVEISSGSKSLKT